MTRGWASSGWEIEQKLSDHYLRSDGDFGATTLSFVDASDEELAKALGYDQPSQARQRFLSSFSVSQVRDVFATGSAIRPPLGIEAPGWFKFLILSCVIAATSSDASEMGDFRRRLAEQLETDLTFSDLHGVAILWHELRRWCELRRKRGEPYRMVRLPDPGAWTHIGHTLKIAFPSRRDLDRISRHFAEDKPDLSKPRTVLALVQNRMHVANWSDAFKAAFGDFRGRALNGERMLSEHPFLIAMRKGCRIAPIFSTGKKCELAVTTDMDGQSVATITFPNVRAAAAAGLSDACAVLDIRGLLAALAASCNEMARDELVISFLEGAIPLAESGWGVWEFERTPTAGRVRLLVRRDVAARSISGTDGNEDWFLTGPLALELCMSVLRRARPGFIDDEFDLLPRPTLSGGIRIGTNHLGLPCCLPTIKASAHCEVAVHPFDGAEGELAVCPSSGGEFRLASAGKLDGRWIAAVSERGSSVLDLGLKFIACALEHESDTYLPDESKWQPEIEITQTVPRSVDAIAGCVEPERYEPSDFPEVLEAVYAGGARGWEETRLVPLLARCLEGQQINVWDALHVLADSGWLEPRLSTGWRARRWFLRPPCITAFGQGLYGLDGASCHIIRARFRSAAEKVSAKLFSIRLPGLWSVPSLFCHLMDPGGPEPDFDLPVHRAELHVPRADEPCVFAPAHSPDRFRTVKSIWSWEKRRFVSMPASLDGPIIVERLQHNGNRAPDIFRVQGPGEKAKLVDSRCAAILMAHMIGKQPMFAWLSKSGMLLRSAREGWLPRDLADCLRLASGVGPAIISTNGEPAYAYPVGPRLIRQLRIWLGGAIASHNDPDPGMQLVFKRRLGTVGALLAARNSLGGVDAS